MTGFREDITSTVRRFVDCINEGDPECLMTWQTENFTFIDYDGDMTQGRDGWPTYFHNNPDYTIHVEHLITSGNGAAIIGTTTGCHVGPSVEEIWTILWTAQVREGLVSVWRIYSDVHEVREKLGIGARAVKQLKENERVKSIVLKFVDCINSGNSRGFMALQTDDFILIDYEGNITRGKSGWNDYFTAFPDYRIHVRHLITSGTGVAVLGKTIGSHVAPEVEEKETILWIAEVRNDLISEWRLYSDTMEIEQQLEGDIDE